MIQMEVLQRAGLPERQCADLREAWMQYSKFHQQPLRNQIKITCVGLYNAGKSTLLNAITQSNHFPTGDIPTTKKIAVFNQKGCTYVDTPGLNANATDDNTTQKALEDTDLLIFVSCIQNGGLTSAEAQWLRYTKQIFGSVARMKARTLFVISQYGRMEETSAENVVRKYQQDIERVLNFHLEPIYPLDVHIWQSGVEQNEPELREFSEFEVFQKALNKRIDMVRNSLKTDWQNDREDAVKRVQDALQALRESCQTLRVKHCSNPQIAALKQKVQDFKQKADSIPKPSVYEYFDASYSLLDLRYESKDKYTAKQEARSRLKKFANRCLSEVRSKLDQERTKLIKKYATSGNESIYFNILNDINQALENIYIEARKIGVELPTFQEIKCAPSNFDLLYSWLESDLRMVNNFGSADFYFDSYKDRIECNEYGGDYVKTLFGVKWQTHYMGDAFWAGCEVRDRISEEFKRRMDAAQYSVRLFFSDFAICASKEVNHQADMICQKIEGYETSIIEKAEEPIREAETYLNRLEQETQQWRT